jgi:hypothetical protein
VSLLLLTTIAIAADLPAGTPVQITDVSPEDAYTDMKGSIVGQRCTVGAGGLTETRAGWHGGNVTCPDSGYFFREVAVTVLGAPEPVAEAVDHGRVVPGGSRFRVADIHPDDAYHGDRATYAGRTCTANGDLNAMEAGWYAGPADCAGQSMYFYKVALTDLVRATAPTEPARRPEAPPDHGPTLAAGTRFRIADIHPDDAFHASRGSHIGLVCTAASEGLSSIDPGWYSGAASCEDGFEPYFYKVAVELGVVSDRGFSTTKIAKGVAVRVVDAAGLPPPLRGVLGEVCVTASAMTQVSAGRYAGRLTCEGLKLKVSDAMLERP